MDGKEDLLQEAPSGLSVQQYAEARAKELLSMYKSANTVIGNTQPIQRLPRHMRRRAASHNVKRLPRKLHSLALREMSKAGTPSKHKRPSRKHRRRPRNLLAEYSRRQRRFVWLETHIWHAKRFHMTEKWGYKIPLHPNDKGVRSAYRATAKYCLLQDLSYHCCIELAGAQKAILELLSHITSPDTGLSFGAKVYTTGQREGRNVIYRSGQYPFGAIGEVQFMWRCRGHMDSDSPSKPDPPTQLWIWTHPAMYMDMLTELKVLLETEKKDIKNLEPNIEENPDNSGKVEKNVDNVSKLQSDDAKSSDNVKIPESKFIKEESFSGKGIVVTSLKDKLCRFHLTGPLSNEILLDALKIADITPQNNEELSLEEFGISSEEEKVCNGKRRWWKSEFNVSSKSGKINAGNHVKQSEFFQNIKSAESPGELQPNCIVGLTLRDPRMFLPRKKAMVNYESKAAPSSVNMVNNIRSPPPEVSQSLLWNGDIRTKVKETKMADRLINSKRSEALLPGSEIQLGDNESRIPVILVQNPGRRPSSQEESMCRGHRILVHPGYCSGWDLIVPGGWGMPFLLALVYRGARAAGLKEIHTTAVEQALFCYPNNYPDTPAGKKWEQSTWQERQSKYDRIPPAKKANFTKLGVVAPYHFPWSNLLKEWPHTSSTLDNNNSGNDSGESPGDEEGKFYVLRNRSQLKKLQNLCIQKLSRTKKCHPRPVKRQKQDTTYTSEDVISSVLYPELCLVPVHLGLVLRGCPDQFSMICLPTTEDFRQFFNDSTYGGPQEPIHKSSGGKLKTKNTTPKDYLNLPKLTKVVKTSTRDIMGFVKDGSFSFASGHGFGLGFVALFALQRLMETRLDGIAHGNTPVLVRSTTSQQYRFAYLSVPVS